MNTPLVGINVSNLHAKAFSKPKTHAVDHKEKDAGVSSSGVNPQGLSPA
jgi:hypothetical protein